MRFRSFFLFLLVAPVLLAGCDHAFEHNIDGVFDNPYADAPAPDYRIMLSTAPNGQLVAVPPECPDWRTVDRGPLQNDPWPQYGCAQARNLAAMAEKPEDLIEGRKASPALGSKAATSMRHYNEEKTMPLIDPNAKAPTNNAGAAMGLASEGAGGLLK